MIFIINEKGKVITQDIEPVYQGSHNSSKIMVLSPLINSSLTVAFDLPNGDRSRTYLLNLQGQEIDYQGQSCCVWLYSLPREITRFAGQVKAQFCFYNGTATVENEQLQVTGSLITTSIISFTVQQGVVAVDESLEETENQGLIEDLEEKILTIIGQEQLRQENESSRQEQEIARQNNESERANLENARGVNESIRLSNETTRISQETDRQTNETLRQEEEIQRQLNESNRSVDEDTRIVNESIRESNERARIVAENNRQVELENLKAITKDANLYTITEVEDTFSTRPTAGGLNVIDGTNATLKKIEGNTVRSKNLFDTSILTPEYHLVDQNGFVKSIEDDWRTVYIPSINLPAGTYTISTTYNCRIHICIKNLDNTWLDVERYNVNSLTFNHTGGEIAFKFFRYDSSPYPLDIGYIQLEEGSTATPYTPYFDGLKHSKFKSLTSTGKNLFDISKANGYGMINNGDGTLTVSEYPCCCGKLKVLCPALKAGDVVNFSFATDGYHQGILNGNNVIYFNKSGTTLTITNKMLNFEVCFYRKVDGNPATISNVLVEYGTTKTSFEPYIESKIELEEPIELKLGETIDFENNVEIHGGHTFEFDGSENWEEQIEPEKFYYLTTGQNAAGNSVCSHLLNIVCVRNIIRLYETEEFTTLQEWKDYLAEQSQNGTPVMVRCLIQNPIVIQGEIELNNKYKVYKNGLEIVENENDTWVDNTLTQEYFTKVGGEDES